jgi:hypothetical protein
MKFFIYDIETLKEYFLIRILDIQTNERYSFRLNKWVNEIDSFIKFSEAYKDYYWVGYNNLRFDAIVLEYVIRNNNDWPELSNLEICKKIWQKAQDTIDNSNYELLPEYEEKDLSNRQIDLFTIWHFNNKNRRTSLKALEYAMDMENIEEMPIHHSQENLTEEDIKIIDDYCDNDIDATYQFYLITRGQTDLKLYKGEDKIGDRLAMMEEFGLQCLNWDDVKIGAEWNKMDYLKASGKADDEIKPPTKEIKQFYGVRFSKFFPRWVSFQTPELQKFVENFGNQWATSKKQEFKFDFSKIVKK